MKEILYSAVDIFCLFLCLFVFLKLNMPGKVQGRLEKIFSPLAVCCMFYAAADAYWGLLASGVIRESRIFSDLTFLIYLYAATMSLIWLVFLLNYIPVKNRWYWGVFFFLTVCSTFVQLGILFANFRTGCVFRVTEENDVRPGALQIVIFGGQVVVYLLVTLSLLVMMILHRRKKRYRYGRGLLFSVPPMLGYVLQEFRSDIPGLTMGMTVSIVGLYIFSISEIIEENNLQDLRMDLSRNRSFTAFFMDNYISTYYVGFRDRSMKIYHRSEELDRKYPDYGDYYSNVVDYIDQDVHPEDREGMKELMRPENLKELLRRSSSYVYQFRDISGGILKYYRLLVIRGADEDHAAFGFEDVTKQVREEQRQAEELKKAKAEAEHASEAKSNFLFSMSHDIRTPMNAIRGYTRMAQKNLNDPDRVGELLKKIDVSGQQLLSLVNQVLDMSQIEAGKVVLHEEETDIGSQVSTLLEVMQVEAEAHGIRLISEIKEIKDRLVRADMSQIDRVLVNILGNAVKYTSSGGTIRFTLEQLTRTPEGYGIYSFLCADTGLGMSREFQERIFEPFARENTSTKSGIDGTGLGMAIVKKVVELLHGSITVESEPGTGTMVRVIFPLYIVDEKDLGEKQSLRKQETEENSKHLEGKKALLVEDNEMNREIASDLLEDFGVEVTEATDGSEAVEMIRTALAERGRLPWDFVLMDIQMPRMNGFEATRQIREMMKEQPEHLPIIAMTANAFETDRKMSLEAGMDAHLAKPIEQIKMIHTIGALVKEK